MLQLGVSLEHLNFSRRNTGTVTVEPESESAGHASPLPDLPMPLPTADQLPLDLSEIAIKWRTSWISGGFGSVALSWIVLDPDEPVARPAQNTAGNQAVIWCCWRGLNSRPPPYQGGALPLSYSSADATKGGVYPPAGARCKALDRCCCKHWAGLDARAVTSAGLAPPAPMRHHPGSTDTRHPAMVPPMPMQPRIGTRSADSRW